MDRAARQAVCGSDGGVAHVVSSTSGMGGSERARLYRAYAFGWGGCARLDLASGIGLPQRSSSKRQVRLALANVGDRAPTKSSRSLRSSIRMNTPEPSLLK